MARNEPAVSETLISTMPDGEDVSRYEPAASETLIAKMSEGQEKSENIKFEEAMEVAGYGKFNVYIVLMSGVIQITSLLAFVDISFLLPAAECDLHLTPRDKGLLGSAPFFGLIAASHLSGFLADTLGRRYVLVRGLSLNVISYVLGSLAPNFWAFFALKVIGGITTCPTLIAVFPYVGEFVPATRRSQALLISTSLKSLGMLYSSAAAWATLQGQWELDLWFVTFTPWRLFYLLCGIPSLLAAVLIYLTPESPKFLLTRGNKKDTLKILQKVYSVNSGGHPQNYPIQSVSLDAGETVPPDQERGFIGVIKHICDQTSPLFKPPFVKDFILCVILVSTAFLCFTSVYVWLPEVTNRITQYGNTNNHSEPSYMCQMVARVDTSSRMANTSDLLPCRTTINMAVFVPNIVLTVANPAGLLFTGLVITAVDRRLATIVALLLGSALAFFVTRIPDAVIIIIMFGSISIMASIVFNVLTTILVDVFPTYIRAMAVSLTFVCGRFGSIVGTQLYSHLLDSRCSLLFHIIAGLFLCCTVAPLGFKLKSKQAPKSTKESTVK